MGCGGAVAISAGVTINRTTVSWVTKVLPQLIFCQLLENPFSCVCCMTTLWTIHHIQIPTFCYQNHCNDTQNINIENTYSISRSLIFTSSSILVVKPLSGADGMCQSRNGPFRIIYRLFKTTDLHRHFRVRSARPSASCSENDATPRCRRSHCISLPVRRCSGWHRCD